MKVKLEHVVIFLWALAMSLIACGALISLCGSLLSLAGLLSGTGPH